MTREHDTLTPEEFEKVKDMTPDERKQWLDQRANARHTRALDTTRGDANPIERKHQSEDMR